MFIMGDFPHRNELICPQLVFSPARRSGMALSAGLALSLPKGYGQLAYHAAFAHCKPRTGFLYALT
jgi:hypothetical protein